MPSTFLSTAVARAQVFSFSGQGTGTIEWYESGVSNGVDYTSAIRAAICRNAKKRYPALSVSC